MSTTAIRITPFGGYDIPGLENWLAEMAAKGLHFSMTTGPLTLFTKGKPQAVQIHLEPIQGAVVEDPQLNALFEEAGWQYRGMFRGSFFVFVSSDLQAQAHTDPATLDYALGKLFRYKIFTGALLILANILLLSLYKDGAPWKIKPWEFDWYALRYFPVDTLFDGRVIPFLLAMVGFFLIELSYLLGLFHLLRYRRSVKIGGKTRGHRGVGWLLAAGLLILLPVLVNTAQYFLGLDYRPYDLEGSGFVTLTDIEGEDFRLSGDRLYNMDYISHGGTLLDPESWYFQQYGSFRQEESPGDVPHLEITITRYPLEALARQRADEYSRWYVNGSGDYEALSPAYGLDEARYAPREGSIHTNELTGETRIFQPGGVLVLRRGNTVLYADYYGQQDLRDYLAQFAALLENL